MLVLFIIFVSVLQEEKSCWMWKKAPPPSRKPVQCENEDGTEVRKVRPKRLTMSVKQRLLKGIPIIQCFSLDIFLSNLI